MKPIISVASAAGTSRASGIRASGSRAAIAKASATAPAPSSSEAMNPTSGSTSRRTDASRIAQARNRGSTTALTATVPSARTTICAESEGARTSGSAASRRPCPASARMQPLRRVVASTAKSESITSSSSSCAAGGMVAWSAEEQQDAEERQRARADQQLRHAAEPQPGHDRLDDADGDGDSRESRRQDGDGGRRAEPGARREDADHQRAQPRQLERAAEQHQREVRSAVIEDDDLVDHGQLEMRRRIVHP